MFQVCVFGERNEKEEGIKVYKFPVIKTVTGM